MATLTPQEELNKIKTDSTFAGGTAYGRVPYGIVDLATGQMVPNTSGVGTSAGVDSTIANSGVRRYTGDYTAPAEGTYASEAAKILGERANAPVKDEATIRDEMRQKAQEQIDAIKNTFAGLISSEGVRGLDRLGQGRAANARGGLLGSDFGTASQEKISQLNADQIKALENERDVNIQGILTKIDSDAYTRAKEATTEAEKSSADYLAYLKDFRDNARTDATNLAKSGLSLNALTDAQYKKLLDNSGYTPDQLNALFTINKPEDKTLTSFTQGNKYYVITQDPITGKKKTETVDLGFTVPTNYQQTKLDDQTIVFYPDKFDPNKPVKDQIMTYQVGTGPSLDTQKKQLDIENQRLQNKKLLSELTSNEPESVKKDLQDAANAIAGGADAIKVRQRFLDSHPTKGDLYLKYNKQDY